MARNPLSEISSSEPDCAHHYFGKKDSMRWYLPGGVMVTQEEHNIFHSSDKRRKDFEEKIIAKRGTQWHEMNNRRRWKIVKYITYKNVLNYLNGQTSDYI